MSSPAHLVTRARPDTCAMGPKAGFGRAWANHASRSTASTWAFGLIPTAERPSLSPRPHNAAESPRKLARPPAVRDGQARLLPATSPHKHAHAHEQLSLSLRPPSGANPVLLALPHRSPTHALSRQPGGTWGLESGVEPGVRSLESGVWRFFTLFAETGWSSPLRAMGIRCATQPCISFPSAGVSGHRVGRIDLPCRMLQALADSRLRAGLPLGHRPGLVSRT